MKKNLHRFIWLFIAILFVVTGLGVGVYAFWENTHNNNPNNYLSCPQKTVTAKQQKKNGKLEGAKLAGFTPVKHVDYLQCWDLKTGTGATVASASSTITATYTGALASNGEIFQSSLDTGQPFSTDLSKVIPGWTAGIPGMKVGGTRRLLIPAQYAYGSQGGPGIPPNSDLVFDVTVLATK
ncbi:MAG TPA: FKBP-type peptidyl-prolyl cis-trans isomerase [Candidatus Saccharimonadales bacterium]|nr:FKBP-type peptidyl-prolyl cis-trans isomerase [Candidatus Saccharimonadales bacterium]